MACDAGMLLSLFPLYYTYISCSCCSAIHRGGIPFNRGSCGSLGALGGRRNFLYQVDATAHPHSSSIETPFFEAVLLKFLHSFAILFGVEYTLMLLKFTFGFAKVRTFEDKLLLLIFFRLIT